MRSITPVLRQARSEVVPLVPEVAPDLPPIEAYGLIEPDVIQWRLMEAIGSRGVDPATVPPADFNKLSRQTMAAAVIGLQRNHLVTGEGSEARFRDSVLEDARIPISGRRKYFGRELRGLQDEGFRLVRSRYTAGPDRASSWFPALDRRYAELGQVGLSITPAASLWGRVVNRYPRVPIAREGQSLYVAMTTIALSSSIEYMLRFVRREVKPTSARVEAAHDIAPQFLGGIASAHFYEMTHPKSERIGGAIVSNERARRYQVSQTRRQRNRVYTHIKDDRLPNTRLKCPAHAMVEGDDTNMMYFVHAAINLAAGQYDML